MLTYAQLMLLIHLGLSVLIIHAFVGGLATLMRPATGRIGTVVRQASVIAFAVVAWGTAVTGTWLVYPGYRAKPAIGADLEEYPKAALLAEEGTAIWHDFGMEWKEHVAWLVPLLATTVVYLVIRHSARLDADARLRRLTAGLFTLAFAATVIAAGLGAVINKVAPNDFLMR
ncbi:hypothetical protein ACTMTI_48075 [Nonomuraea sp. H19]|uniref:hypothetical protein n=1 Tax=Nonomuraea sp. H19 TaxID=3452206 RepID=UPI003F88AEDC